MSSRNINGSPVTAVVLVDPVTGDPTSPGGGGGGSGLTDTQLRAAPVPVRPAATTVTILTAQTQATGTNWTTFGSQACSALDLVNNTGTTIEYRRGGTGSGMTIPSGGSRLIVGITNADQISVRRVDTSNVQVTVQAEAMS